ncbi:MAG: hypothetical protein CVV42_08540 [Candidatus Riflebacteria bacterium HGW-Riflebacteria-2]|nr:MAG: hypothetical protein CVV42_08540 [Candidatus Riflebacteria bacterium HGW-Riflebacteria-2]
MKAKHRDLDLVYDYYNDHFRDINLDDVQLDLSLIPQADAALKSIAQDVYAPWPKLSKPVLKVAQRRFFNYLWGLRQETPDIELSLPGQNTASDAEILAFVVGEKMLQESLLDSELAELPKDLKLN